MMQSLHTFSFELPPKDEATKIVDVSGDISTKSSLLRSLSDELGCPCENWDALSDCLRDLSRIPERRVIIRHADIPNLDLVSLRTYLDVLSDAAVDWLPGERHELTIVFPSDTRERIAEITSL